MIKKEKFYTRQSQKRVLGKQNQENGMTIFMIKKHISTLGKRNQENGMTIFMIKKHFNTR